MAAVTTIAAYGALAAAAVGVHQQQQAQSSQKKANREQRAIARAQHMKEVQDQARQARIARGAALNRAHTSGGVGSPLEGSLGSIGSQAGANSAFAESIFDRSQRAGSYMQRAQTQMGRAQMANTVSSAMAPYGDFGSIFGSGAAPKRDPSSLTINTPPRQERYF